MFSSLTIKFSKDITNNIDKAKEVEVIESYRDFILSICNKEPNIIKETINYTKHSFPIIIYSKPQKNAIRIFGLGEKGQLALNSIYVNLKKVGYAKIKGKEYKLKGDPRIASNIDLLPFMNGSNNVYTTLTPISIFNKKNICVFHAIMKEHLDPNKSFEEHSDEIRKIVNNKLANFSTHVIKENIAYMLSQVLPNKMKEDFPFVDTIKIKWDNIRFIMARYHSEEKEMPMIVGKFTSDFVLPKFVGYKVGKGFGELSHKKGAL